MAKTYQLKALWPLLPIESAPRLFYAHPTAINRQCEGDRKHAIKIARLAEMARLGACHEYAARK